MPRVSPGKTVAGAIGAVVATMLGAWLYNDFVLRSVAQLALALEQRLDSLYFAIPVAYLILSRLLLAAPR
jgi:CDP-diglyceride synthetase